MAAVLHRLAGRLQRVDPDGRAKTETVERPSNNLPDVKLLRAHYLNVRDLLDLRLRGHPAGGAGRDRRDPGLGRGGVSKMHVYDILKRPVVTEKSNAQADDSNQYTFEVDRRANKMQVKDAVETAFNVKVASGSSTSSASRPRPGHVTAGIDQIVKKSARGRRRLSSNAGVPGGTIQFFEGV